jgi:hypothetical protein
VFLFSVLDCPRHRLSASKPPLVNLQVRSPLRSGWPRVRRFLARASLASGRLNGTPATWIPFLEIKADPYFAKLPEGPLWW